MGFSYNVSVLNQKGSPAIYTDTFANRPAFGYAGRLFIANDTSAIYEDTGTAWVLIANVSSGAGTLQQVTTNGNTSNVGISITAGGLSTNSLTDTALTLGSVLFSGAAGLVTQDNAAFFWDDTNNRLGINTTTPSNTLDLHFGGTNAMLGLNNTAGNQSAIVFTNTGTNKWRIGNTATNTFDFFNVVLSTIALQIKANNNAVFISSVQADEYTVQPTGYSILASLSRNLTGSGYGVLTLRNSANGTVQTAALTVDRTYTLPDATGTIALTSDLSAYLPLTGGTLTGTLTLSGSAAECFIIATPNATSLNSKYVYNTNTTLGYIGTGQGLINGGGSSIFAIRSENSMVFSTNGGDIAVTITKATKNVLINSTTDDTVNKLQVNGSAVFQSAISVSSSGNATFQGITSYVQDNNTINLSTIFPGLVSFTGRFVSLQVQIIGTNGGGGVNSSIYLIARSDSNVWTTPSLVSTTGTVVAYTFTFGGTGASPTLAITDGVYIYKSVTYSIIMR